MPQPITAATAPQSTSERLVSSVNLARVRNAILLVVSVAVLLQLIIFFSTDNLAASAMLLCGAFIGLFYSLNRPFLTEYPLSTLAILGYTISYFIIAPLGQLLDFHSVLHNLTHHILVWAYGLTGMLALVVAHYVYRVFSPYARARWSLANFVYRPLHFFEMPDPLQFWLMGFMGVAATLGNLQLTHGGETTTVSSIMRVFQPLIYTPYFMAFPNLLDPRYQPRLRPIRLGLVVYSILVIAVSFMANSRSYLFTGFASLALVYGYRVLTGTISPPRLTFRSFVILLVCAWIVTGPFTNMAASMVVVRKMRGSVSPRELARETWSVYRSGIAVKAIEAGASRSFHRYDETYYNNIFLDRIGNVRFTDISINAANGVASLGDLSYFRKIERDRVIAILPEPFLRALHLRLDKREVLGGSSEDYLYHLATGNPATGFREGFGLVILNATLGMMWPLYVVLMSTVLFVVLDARCDLTADADNRGQQTAQYTAFNPIIAGALFSYATIVTVFGLQDVASYLGVFTRGVIEVALVYAVAFILTKAVSSLVLGWALRAEDVPQRGA